MAEAQFPSEKFLNGVGGKLNCNIFLTWVVVSLMSKLGKIIKLYSP